MSNTNFNLGLDKSEYWDNCEKLGRFDVFFPKVDLDENNIEDIPEYVAIKLDGKNHYLKASVKNSRKGNICVSPSTYKGEPIGKTNYDKCSKLYFLLYKIRNDQN